MADLKPSINESSADINEPVSVNMARFIRAEVAAAVKDQVGESFHAPPSYDSSEPLLGVSSSSRADEENDNDNFDTEAQQAVTALANTADNPTPPRLTWTDYLRVAVSLFPILFIFGGFSILIVTGVDPLAITVLAFFLFLSLSGFLLLLAIVVCNLAFLELT
jgi:hypothetical protein